MRAKVDYRGFFPNNYPTPYCYRLFPEQGDVVEIFDNVFRKEEEIELPDEFFSEQAGWAYARCDNDKCDELFSAWTYPGGIITCPYCDYPQLVPATAVLENFKDYV